MKDFGQEKQELQERLAQFDQEKKDLLSLAKDWAASADRAVAEITILKKDNARMREALQDVLAAFASQRQYHCGAGPITGQIGADDYDRYRAALSALPQADEAGKKPLPPMPETTLSRAMSAETNAAKAKEANDGR